ncbi:MAG: phospho-sugar mutase, partial [Bacteroidales bacterium]|nr:phospho-sugar mutase [Bacteroidales bacterium]
HDYLTQVTTHLPSGKTEPIALPKSDVIQYLLADGSKISIRPSGTEPKIKFYFSVKGKLERKEDFQKVTEQLKARIKDITKDLHIE